MSNTSIQLKKSGATGNTPSGLAFGEVALNYADGKLYYKNSLGGTSYISNQFSFDTINANNSLILATGVSDTLSFVAGNNISISTNTTTKTITIDSSGGSIDQFARDAANSAGSYANAAFAAANTGGSSTDQTARDTANASFAQANAAYASQNTTGIYANSAYTQANTATSNAVGASLYANGAFAQANAAFDKANSVTSGFRANTVIIANSTGYLSNSNAEFSLANNTLYVPNANVSSELTANSLVFYDGTRLNSATGISANTANSAATANVSIFARVTNVTTGTYFPIITDTTVTGADTFHYSSNDFLMYAANNTFRVSGNVWAGQFIAVGSNIPVVNATGHWVGQPLVANNSATANVSNVAVNARITNVTTGTYFPIVTDTTITGADTFHYSSNDFLMYAANNTFRATGNLWAGQFITVGSNIPVVNSTGHWVGQPLVANNSSTANVSNVAINARITVVNTGIYYPIVTDTTISGSDTLHYSSNDFVMFASNNTFRATGNLWAGQFITVGTNIPVVNSTGHWVGQTLTSTDETARTTANSAGSYANAAFLQANAAFAAANLASSNVYSFVGTGSCTSFTLSTTNNPSSNTIIVNIDGVIQLHSTYDVTSNVINFTEAPASNAEIEVQIIAGASGSPNSLTLTPEVNTTSGTSVVLTTAIPSWAKRITVNFYGISLSGTQLPLIQFGTGATPTWATSGYDSSSDNYATTAGPAAATTAGFVIGSTSSAAQSHNGAYTFTLVGSNKWVGTMNGSITNGSVLFGGGRVNLSGEVTAIRLFSNGGTNTYDAGSASVMYE